MSRVKLRGEITPEKTEPGDPNHAETKIGTQHGPPGDEPDPRPHHGGDEAESGSGIGMEPRKPRKAPGHHDDQNRAEEKDEGY